VWIVALTADQGASVARFSTWTAIFAGKKARQGPDKFFHARSQRGSREAE